MKNKILVHGRFIATALLGAFGLFAGQVLAQTTVLISPTGDGGFENGATFAANGWTVVNGATNQWFVGGVGGPSAGSNCAYVSDNPAGTTHNYATGFASTVHFYRDITFPAGQTNITLSFRWKGQGEGSYDYVTVFAMPTSNTPTVNVPAGAFQSWLNIPTAYPGATILCTPPNLNLQANYQTQTICLPASFAGTTQRLVFMWSNDGSLGTQPPGAVDEIYLVSTNVVPASVPTSQPTNLVLAPVGVSSISGTFTAAAGSPDRYLVVRTLTNAPPTAPVDGVEYSVGANALGGVIVSTGPSTSFVATGLTPSTQYYFWVYSYNGTTCNNGPVYLSSNPLTGTATTNDCQPTPANQPTALTFNPALFTIAGSFTPAAGSPEGYLVVRTLTNTPPLPPVDGTTYAVGSNALGGVIVASGAGTSFTAVGLAPATTYYFWVYSFNGGGPCPGPFYLTASPLTGFASTLNCSLSGIRSVGPSGFYTTLTSAIADVLANGAGAPVVLELQSTYVSTVEPAFPIVLPAYPCMGPGNTVTIRPAADATGLSISSAATQTIDINGGNWWRLDGRPGGVGSAKELSIVNTSATGNAIRFINEASNNVVRYCDIQGQNTSTASGVILFSTTTNAQGFGNDNNLVEFNDIHDTPTGTPSNCIYSLGTTSSASTWNSNNTIANNNIYNFFLSTSSSIGVFVSTGSRAWTITGNSFYQTVPRTLAAAQFSALNFNNTITGDFVITNNFIGGTAPQCGGSAMTLTGAGNFRGMNLTVSGAPTLVQGNTIRNINLTSSTTNAFNGAILLGQGTFNCTDNIVGSLTENNSIVLTFSGTATGLTFGGIVAGGTSATNTSTISNNSVGGISMTISGAPASPATVRPISVQGTTVGHNFIVNGNTIGSATLANSITNDANIAGAISAIVSFSNAPDQQITNNTIANMTASSTGTANVMWGILAQGNANIGTFAITGNTIRNLSSASSATGTGGAASIMGISITTNLSTFGVNNVSQNTVHSLVNTNPTAAASVTGIVNSVPTVTNNTLARNFIHSLNLQSTTLTGIATGIQLNAGTANVQNNMIRLGVDAAGNDITSGYGFFGIREAAGNNNVHFNSVYIGGSNVDGASNTFAFTSAATTGVRNYLSNIFVNARSNGAGTGKHYATTFSGTTPNPAGVASNYNDLFVSGTGGFIGLYNGVDQTTLAAWRTATGNDIQSVSGNPQFVAPNGDATTVDLHIQTGVATVVEAGGQPVLAASDDFDGQSRNGFTPTDIGADAGNFTLSDASGPGIAYTPLIGACGTGNIALGNVTITDGTGIPLAGALVPRIYYRKGAGAWFSNAGTLASGNATNSNWNFTIIAADMGGLAAGDVVSYYVIAQDNLGNIGSNAGGAIATDVNNITTHPALPNTATVQLALSGTYTVGAGGDYPTLTAAVADYNARCIAGPIVFSLISATYPSETFPIAINANAFASATNTLTIRPAAGNTATISGLSPASSALIRLNGADWVTIDGSNSGGTDRSLSLINTSTSTSTAVIWVSSVSILNGATNNTIKNCNIAAGSNTVTSTFGIYAGGASITTTGTGDNNDNLVIQNNAISRAYYAIYARAASFLGTNDGLQIIGNSIGSNTPADYVIFRGIDIQYANAPLIAENTIFNMITTVGSSIAAVDLGTGAFEARVLRNNIRGIQNTSASGWGSYGVNISGTAGTINILIANNFISDFLGANYPMGTSFNAFGIRLAGGYYTKIYNNSINFFGNHTSGSSAGGSANLVINTTLAQGTEIRNNIFRNTHTFTVSGSNIYNVYTVTGAQLAVSDNNAYYGVSSPNTTYHVGFDGQNKTTLANWRQYTGQDGASFLAEPNFVSNTDLHLQSSGNLCFDGAGAPLALVTVDYDGENRDPNTPDVGADEFVQNPVNIDIAEDSGLSPNDGIICELAEVTLTADGGVSYAWSTGFNGNPLVINPAGLGDVTYTVTVTDANGCTAVSSVTITVNELPFIQAMTGGGFYCSPGAGVEVGLSGSQIGINYQLTRDGIDVGAPVPGTGQPLSFGFQTIPGAYNAYSFNPLTGCESPVEGPVFVEAEPTPTAFSVTGGGAYCEPGNGVPVGLSGSEQGVEYQLQRGGVDVGAPVAGTGAALAFGNQTVAGVYTVVATSANGGCTSDMNGSSVTVTANPTPSLSAVVTQPTTCLAANGAINLTVANGATPYTYNWFTPNGSGLVQGQEDQSGLIVGLYQVTVTDDNGCTAAESYALIGPGNCDACPVIGSLSTTPAGACAGANITLTASGLVDMGSTYGITFKFYGAPAANPYTGGTVIATVPNSGLGNNGTTATTTTSFPTGGTYYLYAILDELPTDPSCRPSAAYTLTVLNIPSADPVSPQTVCAGSSTAPVNFSGPISGTVFNWTNNNPGIGLAANGTGNIASFVAINNGTAPVTATITVTPSVSDTASGTTCTGTPITFTITVNPVPTVNAVASATYCNGAAVPSVVFTSNVPGATFSWSRTPQAIGLAPTSGTGNVPAFTAANATNAPVTSTFTVVASFTNNGVTCTGTPIQFSITVNPTPNVTASPASQTVCNGAPTTTINFSGLVAGTVFNWTNNNTSIGLAASGTGNNIPTFVAVNNGGTPVTATITVTPTFTNNGVFCSGTPIAVTITVNPTAQVNQPANVNGCAGSLVTVNFTTTTPGTTYSWTNSNPAIGLAAAGTGNISFTAAVVAAATTGTITVTPNYSNNGVSCPGTPRTFTITINPNPTVNAVPNQVWCSGDITTLVSFTGAFAGTVFNWTNSNPSIGLAASGTGNIPAFVTQNTTPNVQTATITVTPSLTTGGTTCTGTPITFTYTVFPRPIVTLPANGTICQDQVAFLTATLGGGATGGTWSGGAGQFVPANAPATQYIPAVSEYGTTVTLTFTSNDPAGPCPAVSASTQLTINTLPLVFAGNDLKICPGATLSLATLNATITANGSGVTTGTWSTSGSGQFQPNNNFPGATTYVPSAADYAAGFVILTLTSADPAGPCGPVSDAVRLGFKQSTAPVCNDNVQVSLDSSGVAEINPDMVLEGTYDDEFYTVSIIQNGLSIGNTVNCSHVGKTFTFRVTDICTNNVCWGTIKVEDKLPPRLTCNNYNLVCVVSNYDPSYILNTLGVQNAFPTVQENCPPATLTYIDDFTDLDCSQQFSARIRRTWTAVDASGNMSSCLQTINFERRNITQVQFPSDVTLNCSASAVNTAPSATGAPFFAAFGQNWPILPTVGACEIQTAHVDQVLPVCDGTYKILRTWTVFDWCLPTNPNPGATQNPKYFIQVIQVKDDTGPTIACPSNLTVSTDPLGCCGAPNMPDVLVEDGCSRIKSASARIVVRDPVTNLVVATYELDGTLSDFSGNNYWTPDTLAVFGFAPCLPLGAHTVTYTAEDDCGNTRTCTFRLTVDDQTPPTPACDDFTNVSLGVSGEAFVNAMTFDDGSYDNCGTVSFKARRMSSNGCQSNGQFHDQVKFCCEDIGDTIMVVLRVYDVTAQSGSVSLTYEEQNANDCMVRVFVEDKIKPFCKAPANVSVSCENFDPTLWAYGFATAEDNCCVDTVTETRNLSLFDTVCNRGTITRTFRALDCGGQSATCTQRVFVSYAQSYFVRFPDDRNVFVCDGTGNFGEPTFFGEDCELLGVSHQDEIFTVVPDACYKIERTWTIINWCTYNPNAGCIEVPNPNPNALTNSPQNLPGPIVSPAGTPAPWAPTVVAITPGATPTNYSTFWNANANCYRYKQIIKIIDNQKPSISNCPSSPQEVCDLTSNDGTLWNAMYWWDNTIQSHDLCEAPTDLTITATDACSGANINIRYLLFLDLDGDGAMETVVNSTQTGLGGLGWNRVNVGNANNPNYGGGTAREFDFRPVPGNQKYGFAIQTTVSGNNRTAAVRWNTQQAQANYVVPELPYGVHKIKWFVEDGCGNEETCEYVFEVKDCKKPTVVCVNGLAANIMPTKMITLSAGDFLQYTNDNCTPSNRLVTAIRKAGQGTGFPLLPNGQPQTTVTFTCAELGQQNVEIWSRDLAGNADFCITYVLVQDNMNSCNSTSATVAGALKTEAGAGLEDATVSATGGGLTVPSTTDASGSYALGGLPHGGNYTVAPLKDNDPLNGVSTFDLVLINKHILGLEPLNSPYKMIAADANNSRSITTFDIVELRKLILGLYTELPNNTSWRFVDAGFQFPNASNPFQTIFPETKQFAALSSDKFGEDFVAVKVGDVNGNALTSSLTSADDRTAGTLLFDVEDRAVKAGEVFTVAFKAAEQVQGYQFTLNHPGLELMDIRPGDDMTLGHFGVFAQEQAVTTSWDGAARGAFALTFRATKSGDLSGMLGVSGRITKAEAYSAGSERLQVGFRFNGANGPTITGLGFELYQNQPNPFVNKTQIGFHLPEATDAVLTVFDETGRLLFTQRGNYAKGYNAVTIDRAVLNTTGVLYYKLETDKDSATRKMIQTK